MTQRLKLLLEQLPQLSYPAKGPSIIENFIVIEGLDGSGSSTQARLLEQHFWAMNKACQRSAEPTTGIIGRHIRTLLQGQSNELEALSERGKLAQFFAADRAEHLWGPDGICAKAAEGISCISERYLFSSLVYQGLDEQSQTSLPEIWDLNRDFPLPQHFFYLDISAEAAEQRIILRETEQQVKREIFEEQQFLAQIRQAYLAVLQYFDRVAPAMKIHHLDATQSRDILQSKILECLGLSL